jgi:GNAT superfamily N-acetyltransferase
MRQVTDPPSTTGSASRAALRFATSAADIDLARALFAEYARSLDFDLCFQGFEHEMAALPGAYAQPRGRLIIAAEAGSAFGCVALRPLAGASSCDGASARGACGASVGEVKRLYVRDTYRGGGWGRRLAQTVVDEARAIGYRELKLDTHGSMHAARALYASLGFRPCAPYYHNPLPDVIYMSLALDGPR